MKASTIAARKTSMTGKLMRAIFVLAISMMFITTACPAAEQGMRIIKVRIAADQEFRKYANWESLIRKRIQEVSALYERNFGIKIEIKDVSTWESIDPDLNLYKIIADLKSKISTDDADVVVAFSGKMMPSTKRAISLFYDQYVVIMDWPGKDGKPKLSEAYTLSTTAHEILHSFGVWHVRDQTSIMAVENNESSIFDERTKQYMALMKNYDLKAGVVSIDQATIQKIIALYSQDNKSDAEYEFPLVQNYSEKANQLTKEKKFDEAIEVCRKALALYPASSRVHTQLGTILYSKYVNSQSAPLCEEALGEFRKAVELNPKDGVAYSYIAQILCFSEHKYAEAWDAVQQAQKLDAFVAPSLVAFLKTKIDVKEGK